MQLSAVISISKAESESLSSAIISLLLVVTRLRHCQISCLAAFTKCTTSSLGLPRWQRTERSERGLRSEYSVYTNKDCAFAILEYKLSPTHELPLGALFCVRFSLTILSPFCVRAAREKGGRSAAAAALDERVERTLPWRCISVCVVNMTLVDD